MEFRKKWDYFDAKSKKKFFFNLLGRMMIGKVP
jgi:hypothetical protein